MSKKRPALGKGLKALIPDAKPKTQPVQKVTAAAKAPADGGVRVRSVPIELLQPNPSQPRRQFEGEELEGLADSIGEHGILQPILARQHDGGFVIVAGERRWRAAQLAGLKEVPVLPIAATDRNLLVYALIENIQRADLNPVEEAEAYRRLKEEYGLSQQEVADRVGKSRPSVANSLRILELPGEIKNYLIESRLSAGHAKALLSLDDRRTVLALGRKAMKQGWSVRRLEQKVGGVKEGGGQAAKAKQQHSPAVKKLLGDLETKLGSRIELKMKNKQQGKLILHYQSLDELDRIIARITGERY